MFEDLTKDIDHFHGLAEARKTEILKEIMKRAAKDFSKFKNHLATLGFGLDANRSVFYEAIWKENPEGTTWETWLLDEIIFLIRTAEQGDKDAIEDLSAIFYLVQLENRSQSFYRKAMDLLTSKLTSNIPKVRENCVDAMLDINDVGDFPLEAHQVKALQQQLEDKVFKNRIYAYCNLKELNLLPKDFNLSKFDKMRAKVSGYSGYIE